MVGGRESIPHAATSSSAPTVDGPDAEGRACLAAVAVLFVIPAVQPTR